MARGQAALASGGRLPGQLLVARALAGELEERIARHCAVRARTAVRLLQHAQQPEPPWFPLQRIRVLRRVDTLHHDTLHMFLLHRLAFVSAFFSPLAPSSGRCNMHASGAHSSSVLPALAYSLVAALSGRLDMHTV